MWGVPVEMMCRGHLLGEHNEMHQIVGSIRKHPYGKEIAEGHAEKGQMITGKIQSRHDKLAEEMRRRGYNHDSPMDYNDELDIGVIDASLDPNIQAPSVMVELLDRCSECRQRRWDILEQTNNPERYET